MINNKNMAIQADNIGKRYQLGKSEIQRYTIRERINQYLRLPFASGSHTATNNEFIWALRNVSFQIGRGEIVGVIGRNGAGKSTLLKILSSITEPTEGQVAIEGRVASLLELGTGFHPELTGRENILLNAAMLGMKRSEIARKFDSIVEFSEIEKFIDTPVKHYSSGMYLRLAFAVAANLNPEILLVDEVLAVGDAAFQKKCLGKMGDVSKEGRTILFVSHNLGAVLRMCERCIWLDNGSVKEEGQTSHVIRSYIRTGAIDAAVRIWSKPEEAPGDATVRLRAIRICQSEGLPTASIDITKEFQIEIETDVQKKIEELTIAILITNGEGYIVFHSGDIMDVKSSSREPGLWSSICRIPAFTLNAGFYTLTVGADIPNHRQIFLLENALSWNVEPLSKEMGRYEPTAWKGIIGPGAAKWSVQNRRPQ